MYKKVLILIIMSLLAGKLMSQNYYWNGDRKVILERDYSSLVVYENDSKGAVFENMANIIEFDDSFDKNNGHYKVVNLKRSSNSLSFLNKSKVKGLSFGFKNQRNETFFLTYDVIVKLQKGINLNEFEDILNNFNASIIANEFGVFRIRVNELDVVLNLANEIYETGKVEWSLPDFLIKVTQNSNWEKQYYLHNTNHSYCGFNHDINAYEAWGITMGCDNVIVAVIDDGVENHPSLNDFNGVSRVMSGYTPSGITEYGRPGESDRHGQACAGIIAATHSLDIKGIAPNVKILPIKIRYGSTPISEFVNAFNYARENGADVISNSWKIGGDIYPIIEAIQNAQVYGRGGNLESEIPGLGAIVVFSSGNNGSNEVSPLAKVGIAVGALNKKNTPAENLDGFRYTNIGPNQDLVAYGGDYVECFDGYCECDIRTIDRVGSNGYNEGDYTNGFGGTSAACPQVSGVAALILSVNPNLSREEVENIMFSTATDMGSVGFDNIYGYGRVNAFLALQEAVNTLNENKPFFVSEGFLSYEKIHDDETVTFTSRPHCNISSGLYICDVYKAEAFIPYTHSWFWYVGDGLSGAYPNNGTYYVIQEAVNGGLRLTTFFYFVERNLSSQELNVWVPNNPEETWTRKYLIAPKETVNMSSVVEGDEILHLRATESINLNSGFQSEQGAIFSAEIVSSPDDVVCLPNPGSSVSLKKLNAKCSDIVDFELIQAKNQQEVIIYPNPCVGNFYVNFNSKIERNSRIEIFNLQGNIIFSSKLNSNNQSVSFTNSPGIYLVRIYNGSAVYSDKIILQ